MIVVRSQRIEGGSGTLVARDHGTALVITCKHLFTQPGSITIYLGGRQGVAAQLLASDRIADLAALVVPDPGLPMIAVTSTSAITEGQSVSQIGFPRMRGPNERRGQIQGLSASGRQGNRSLMVRMRVEPGDSGSGLFAGGRLLAVVWGAAEGPWGSTAYASDPADLVRFYSEVCLRWRRRQPEAPALPALPGRPSAPGSDGASLLDQQFHRLEEHLNQLESALKSPKAAPSLGKISADLADLKSRQDHAANSLGRLELLGGSLGQGIDALSQAGHRLHRIDQQLGQLQALKPALAPVASLLSWMPWLAGGAATGGLVPILFGAFALGRWLLGRSAPVLADGLTPARPAPAASISASPGMVMPPPQVVRDEHTYVPYERPNGELEALKMAMDEMVRRFPGVVDTIETMKKYAQQFLSGQKTTPKP